jgi:EAL domain-containing protein (putative c-di-GMP-specific phosphodiesterase class I)
MEGVEALIRWNHPSRGVLTPASFIHVAEESGLIVPMGDWVLEAACAQQRIWQLKGMPPVRMAVNISALQFAQPDFVENVKRLMHNTCVGAEYLELELTESMVMCSSPEVMQRLEELKSLGVQLSLDDFGTGFSSLSYLQRFPIHRLKIDQSFMRGIDQNPVNASIVRAMVGLARSLSMQVVAEGVETEAELEAAIDSGCDESQGYLHARPMSGEQVEAWFQAGDFHARVRPT